MYSVFTLSRLGNVLQSVQAGFKTAKGADLWARRFRYDKYVVLGSHEITSERLVEERSKLRGEAS